MSEEHMPMSAMIYCTFYTCEVSDRPLLLDCEKLTFHTNGFRPSPGSSRIDCPKSAKSKYAAVAGNM